MFLLYQTTDGASHGDNVIIGMRRKYDHTFWIGLCTLRTIGVVSIRLAARPTSDGVLQIVENLDVYIIGRTVEGKQLTQTVFVIIFVSQF